MFLDARLKPGARFAERFPAIAAACRAAGVDPARRRPDPGQRLAVAVRAAWRSGHRPASCRGNWACGEAACTGLMADRLARRFADRSACPRAGWPTSPAPRPAGRVKRPHRPLRRRLRTRRRRDTLSRGLGVLREEGGLRSSTIAGLVAVCQRLRPSVGSGPGWLGDRRRGLSHGRRSRARWRTDSSRDALAKRSTCASRTPSAGREELRPSPPSRSSEPDHAHGFVAHDHDLEPLVRASLLEDLGRGGDLTSDAIAPAISARAPLWWRAERASSPGSIWRRSPFADRREGRRSPSARGRRQDRAGEPSPRSAPRGPFSAERTALNFLLPSERHRFGDRVDGLGRRRARANGFMRRRLPACGRSEISRSRRAAASRLASMMRSWSRMIRIAVQGVRIAIERAAGIGHLVKIEVEVDTLAQLRGGPGLRRRRRAARQYDARAIARGGNHRSGAAPLRKRRGTSTSATAPAITTTGVDLISVGWLTHSAPALDIGLDFFVACSVRAPGRLAGR